jgi:ketosteroid isomerase-like protein
MRSLPLLAAAALAVGCAATETPEQAQARMQAESDSVRRFVEDLATRFSQFVNNKQSDSIAALYAGDARIMPPNDTAVTGSAAVKAMFDMWFSQGTPTLEFTVQNVTANGPIAIERGTFRWTFAANPGAQMPSGQGTGKYLVHWHRFDGQWRIVEDIWNDDAPPPPPPRRR